MASKHLESQWITQFLITTFDENYDGDCYSFVLDPIENAMWQFLLLNW